MTLQELLEGRDWTAISLADAIKKVKGTLTDADVTIETGEIIFTIPAGEDAAPAIKGLMRPFIIKTQYDRTGGEHKYHYFLTRPLNRAEITRITRSI